jgi:hypothetical protein
VKRGARNRYRNRFRITFLIDTAATWAQHQPPQDALLDWCTAADPPTAHKAPITGALERPVSSAPAALVTADRVAQFWHQNAINGIRYDDDAGQSSDISVNNPQYAVVRSAGNTSSRNVSAL